MKTKVRVYIMALENGKTIEFYESEYMEGKTITMNDLRYDAYHVLNSESNSIDRIFHGLYEGNEDFIEIELVDEKRITINRNKVIYIQEERRLL